MEDSLSGKYTMSKGGESRRHHVYDQDDNKLSETYIADVLMKYPPKRDGVYLDIGGGGGETADKIEELYGGKVIVTDLSDAPLLLSDHEMNVVAEATSQPLASGSIDLVHTKDVVVHVQDQEKLLN